MNLNLLKFRRPRLSHEARILVYLKKKGKHGACNYELSHPEVGGLAWHRRITDLRKEGWLIVPLRLKNGVWAYYLKGFNEE